MSFDLRHYNRAAWDHLVDSGNEWTRPVSSEQVEEARKGTWSIVLTPCKAVPRSWFPEHMEGSRILCLASGGGQQAPLLAAAGASVCVFDNSPKQLMQDQSVAERDGLALELVEGDMRDLGVFDDGVFDLIVNPCSTCFIPELDALWSECARVLRPGGKLMTGFVKPELYIFELAAYERGELVPAYRLPYSDLESLSEEERAPLLEKQEPLNFSHTLEGQIGGQLAAGLRLEALYEDRWPEEAKEPFGRYAPAFVATLAVKPELD